MTTLLDVLLDPGIPDTETSMTGIRLGGGGVCDVGGDNVVVDPSGMVYDPGLNNGSMISVIPPPPPL